MWGQDGKTVSNPGPWCQYWCPSPFLFYSLVVVSSWKPALEVDPVSTASWRCELRFSMFQFPHQSRKEEKWSLVPTGWYCLRMRQHRCLPVSKHPPPHKCSNSLAFWKLPSAAEDNSLSSRWYICLWRAFQTVRLSYSLVYILMWLDWWFIVVPNRKNFCIPDCLQGVTSGQLP